MRKLQRSNTSVLFGIFSWVVLIITTGILFANADEIVTDQIDSRVKILILVLVFLMIISFFLSSVGIYLAIKYYRRSTSKKSFIISLCVNLTFIAICIGIALFSINAIFGAMMGI